jgi:hypothetical protein
MGRLLSGSRHLAFKPRSDPPPGSRSDIVFFTVSLLAAFMLFLLPAVALFVPATLSSARLTLRVSPWKLFKWTDYLYS